MIVYDTPFYKIVESNSHEESWIFTNKKNGKFFLLEASFNYIDFQYSKYRVDDIVNDKKEEK
jgi:hypothetical protein